MDNILIKNLAVPVSMTDSQARLSYHSTFDLFMDTASEHAEQLGLGGIAMLKRGLIWLAVRTQVKFYQRPALMDKVRVSTWPAPPSRIRCARYYTLHDGHKLLIEGKNEWAVIEAESGKLHGVADIYPESLTLLDDTACDTPFIRMDENFSDAQSLGSYTVQSTDIDLGGHMNNVKYIRAIMASYSTEQLKSLNPKQMDIIFRAPCFEGEKLTLWRRQAEDATEIAILRPDSKVAVLFRMV